MLKIEKTDIHGWEAAIRGARNSFNSWDKSDSGYGYDGKFNPDTVVLDEDFEGYMALYIGPNDQALMKKLAKAGPSHAKYRRFITVTMDITGPLYWWKEMDTYKVGTVGNSCSTMHKIADKEFEFEDFSWENLTRRSMNLLEYIIGELNYLRDFYNNWDKTDANSKNANEFHSQKEVWWQMIQLLPSSYNQKRTLLVNYEVLANIYHQRKGHRLDEWKTFCEWIEGLPMSEIITGEEK